MRVEGFGQTMSTKHGSTVPCTWADRNPLTLFTCILGGMMGDKRAEAGVTKSCGGALTVESDRKRCSRVRLVAARIGAVQVNERCKYALFFLRPRSTHSAFVRFSVYCSFSLRPASTTGI